METDEFCTLLDSEDIVGVLDIVLLETLLEILDKDDEMREEDVVGMLLEVAELCGLEEPEPDPPPQAVK